MKSLGALHGRLVHSRRVETIARCLAELVPPDASVLDVGCGDGRLAARLAELRADVTVTGIDTFVRGGTRIPVGAYDGVKIPHSDDRFDVVTLVDVLHHTDNAVAVLAEAARVARRCVVVKDHLLDGFLAGPTLQLMDFVGNAPHGVVLPYHYWPRATWERAFERLGLSVSAWIDRIGLYPFPASLVFERGLHFVARLDTARFGLDESPAAIAWQLACEASGSAAHDAATLARRFDRAGARAWRRESRIAQLFCGRGSGLVALERLGFGALHGVDPSPALLGRYRGSASCHVADCRKLPFADGSLDVLVMHDGVQRLDDPTADFEHVLREAERVLTPGGRFVMIEPWPTTFLRLADLACGMTAVRLLHPALDARYTMSRLRGDTRARWLAGAASAARAVESVFRPERSRRAWGWWTFVGTRSDATLSR